MQSRRPGFAWRRRLWAAALGAAVGCLSQGPAQAGAAASLLYAEPLAATWQGAPAARGVGGGSARGTLHFRAFGRDFDLELAPNAHLAVPADDVALQAGTVAGAPGSWARLTRHGEDLAGLFYDGAEYYGIEPVSSLVTVLAADVVQPETGNMVYRLADMRIDPAAMACGTGEAQASGAPPTAATAVRALAAELAAAAAGGPAYRVHVAPVADYEFGSRFGANAVTEILARLNIADGIFSSQAGVDIVADAPTVFTSTAPPYPLTATGASELLKQVSDYRLGSGTTAGITHLFTNKTFANRLVGIAWQGAVCFDREGAGLSTSAGLTTVTSGLVAAHEIGHNFGAPHDGEAGSPCESTPQTYLMAPRNTGSSTFSACSLERMAVVISERAAGYPACLTSVTDFDIAVVPPGSARTDPGVAADLLVLVQNIGNEAATALNLRVHVPAPLQVTGVATGEGYCDFSPTDVSCDLASLAAGANWGVHVLVTGTEQRSYALQASVTAAADGAPDNNARSFTLTVGNPPAATESRGGGGGGGAADLAGLLALLALALLRRPRAPPGCPFDRRVRAP